MNKFARKPEEKELQSSSNAESKTKNAAQPAFQLVDKRPATLQMKKLQGLADSFIENKPIETNRTGSVAQKMDQGSLLQTSDTVQLKKPNRKNRSSMSAEDREARREARFSSTTAGGTTVFDNKEGRLPRAPKGTHYIETDSGKGRENRGKRRIVSLVEDAGGRVLKQYSTYDHYETFEEIR